MYSSILVIYGVYDIILPLRVTCNGVGIYRLRYHFYLYTLALINYGNIVSRLIYLCREVRRGWYGYIYGIATTMSINTVYSFGNLLPLHSCLCQTTCLGFFRSTADDA